MKAMKIASVFVLLLATLLFLSAGVMQGMTEHWGFVCLFIAAATVCLAGALFQAFEH